MRGHDNSKLLIKPDGIDSIRKRSVQDFEVNEPGSGYCRRFTQILHLKVGKDACCDFPWIFFEFLAENHGHVGLVIPEPDVRDGCDACTRSIDAGTFCRHGQPGLENGLKRHVHETKNPRCIVPASPLGYGFLPLEKEGF